MTHPLAIAAPAGACLCHGAQRVSILRPLAWLFDAMIRGYQRWISPLTPPSCRFSPTCSQYARDALAWHPLWRALPLVGWRILRCQPLSAGGFDPVPAGPYGPAPEPPPEVAPLGGAPASSEGSPAASTPPSPGSEALQPAAPSAAAPARRAPARPDLPADEARL